MRLIKSLFCAAVLCAWVPASKAQPINVGIEGGIYLANLKYQVPAGLPGNLNYDGSLKPGLRLGVCVEGRLSPGIWLQTGLTYIRKGANDVAGFDRIRLGYLQVPFYFVGKVGNLLTGRLALGGGPYIAAAVDGSRRAGGVSYDVDFGDGTGNTFRRFDAGLGITLGLEVPSRYYLRANADFGLANIRPAGSSENRIRNWGFGLSLGYRLL